MQMERCETRLSKAIELFTKSCDLGDSLACYNLGIMYKTAKRCK